MCTALLTFPWLKIKIEIFVSLSTYRSDIRGHLSAILFSAGLGHITDLNQEDSVCFAVGLPVGINGGALRSAGCWSYESPDCGWLSSWQNEIHSEATNSSKTS